MVCGLRWNHTKKITDLANLEPISSFAFFSPTAKRLFPLTEKAKERLKERERERERERWGLV